MANAATNTGCFQWFIHDVFLPWQKTEATFYLGSPTVTQWKVTLQPLYRRIKYRQFKLSFEFDEWFYPRGDILVERLLFSIFLNENLQIRKEVSNYRFHRGNQFSYYFRSTIIMYPQEEFQDMEIRIEITLPGRAIRNEVGRGLFPHRNDLSWLSGDLFRLLGFPKYCNMNLLAWNVCEPLKVHNYIIETRWDNFFKLHYLAIGTRNTVQTNISPVLLVEILKYIYSGTFRQHSSVFENAAYSAELFQVIDRYKLYHLYKVFGKSDLLQVRITRNPVFSAIRLFPLDVVDNRSINNNSYTWCAYPKSDYKFIFRFRIRQDGRSVPQVSYSLRSKCTSSVYAEVNLEVVKGDEVNDLQRMLYFHGRNFTINPEEVVKSKFISFRGCGENLGDMITVGPGGLEIEYLIRCFFYIVDGKELVQVRNEHNETLERDEIIWGVLSDHMHQLKREPKDKDMTIISRWGSPKVSHSIHKAILASRIPEIERFFRNNIPSSTDLLSSITLPILLEYMYTGKIFTIPFSYLHEIERFANGAEFQPLIDLINRVRTRWLY